MKKVGLTVLLFAALSCVRGQVTGSFIVKGSINNYYPVAFFDGGWSSNVATEATFGRSSVHTDSSWRGSIISKFRFHTTYWGNGSAFIDADLRQNYAAQSTTIPNFVAGWMDGSHDNGSEQIVIWFRGGNTTYYYTSNYAISPVVHDSVQNVLPFLISGGPSLSSKTTPDSYVDLQGIYTANDLRTGGNISSLGTGPNYLAGSLAIGTTNPYSYMLAVNGSAIFTSAWVKPQGNWPDYVFKKDYSLMDLAELEGYIAAHRHLPGIVSAAEVKEKGLDIGQQQAAVLQKVEELTLYLIDENNKLKDQNRKIEQQRRDIEELKSLIQKLK